MTDFLLEVLGVDVPCRDNPSAFYGSSRESRPGGARIRKNREREAVALCRTCPVQHDCAAYALERAELHGVWGGVTETERANLLRGTVPPPRGCKDCGTPLGDRDNSRCTGCYNIARREWYDTRGGAQRRREQYLRRVERLAQDPSLAPHGVAHTYRAWGCRCAPCTAAMALSRGSRAGAA